ncbi:RNA-binding protein 7 isoform X1 [Ornithorhynchus anatinus]|nr:RNA-binding protein 7 isoform X1 [Ornithorhynchus anatinus]
MGASAAEADRTLFVGNLDTKVTEELLFELFHQAGPVINVKIPKDKDGKPKQFAFVNFKHEESVPYGMNLLNGIKLFGRPIKIQFRSGSSHVSQDTGSPYSQYGNTSPSNLPMPTPSSRYERNMENTSAGYNSGHMMQRSFSSPENLQRHAVMNNVFRSPGSQYGGKFGSQHPDHGGFSPPGPPHGHSYSSSSSSQRRQDSPLSHRKVRQNSHPYQSDRHHSREPRYGDHGPDHHYRGGREDFCYEDRVQDGWSHDYDNRRDNSRDGKWRPSRH